MTKKRFAEASKGVWADIIGNLALAAIKGTVGLSAGSLALVADAVRSVSDIAYSLAILIGLKSVQPSRNANQNDQRSAVSVSATVTAIVLIFIGIQIGISAGRAMAGGDLHAPREYALIVVIFAFVFREAMILYKSRFGKSFFGPQHRLDRMEQRLGLYASIAVFAGIGGALLGKRWHLPWMYDLDPLAGLVVAFLIVRMGVHLMMEAIHSSSDQAAHAENTDEMWQLVQRVEGVIAIEELHAREHGHYVAVDMKISVNPRISVLEGHDIAKMVKQRLMDRFTHIADVSVFVTPYDPGYPYKNPDAEEDDHPHILH